MFPYEIDALERRGWVVVGASTFADGGISVLMFRELVVVVDA